MKIKESRFYREIRVLELNGDDQVQLMDKNRYLTSKAPFRYLLSDILCDVYLANVPIFIP